jgi:hypothetical protein
MTQPTEFDSRPDPALGAWIRDVLDGPDGAAFVARLRQSVVAAGEESPWDVLTRWAPAGLVTATAAAVLVWMLAWPMERFDEGEQLLASAPTSLEVAPGQPEYEVLTAALLEGR